MAEIIRIVTEDRVGLLADISAILGEEKINIDSIGVDIIGEKAIVVLGVDNAEKSSEVLKKKGYSTNVSKSLLIKIPNRPGELSKLSSKLAENKVNLLNVHMLLKDSESGVFSLVVDKPKEATNLLEEVLIHKIH